MATTISTNSPKLTADVASRAEVYGGRGLVFDGTSDYLSVNDDGTNGNGLFDHVNVSVSFWTKIPTSGSSFPMYPLATFEGQIAQFVFTMNSATQLNIQNNNSTSPISNIPTVETGVWEHWAATREPWSGQSNADAHQFKVYRNGELIATRQQNSAWLLHKANLTIGRIGNSDSGYFNGSMCDMKIWTGYTLSLSEIQEIYKKPEQSAPSASLSYLSAWYPMSEANPESPQSIVYDHSEKGKLSSELVSGGDMSNLADAHSNGYAFIPSSNWTYKHSANSGGSATQFSQSNNGALRIFSNYEGIDYYTVGAQNTGVVTGTLYKLTFDAKTNDASKTNLGVRYSNGSNMAYGSHGLDVGVALTTSFQTFTYYFVPTAHSNGGRAVHFGRHHATSVGANTSVDATIDNVSVKEVIMGNHATTNFFGDDLTNGHGAFDVTTNWSVVSGSLGTQWSIGSSKATHATGNTNSLRYENSSNPTTSGKKYQVDFTISGRTAGNLDFAIGGGSASSSDFTASGSTILTSGGSASRILDIITSSDFDGSVDLITVKEVGISSSGFLPTTNEPTIPQIPLVRYNEKMVFKGTSGQYVDVLIPSVSDFSFGFWYNTDSDAGTFIGRSTYAVLRYQSNLIAFRGSNSSNAYIYIASSNIKNGNFIVFVREGTTFKIYIDGVLKSTTTSSVPTENLNFGGNARIGSSTWNKFNGIIHECSIFNSALTQTQVQELFNDGVALDATTHSKSGNLLGYWRNDGISTWKNRADNFASFDGVNDVIARNAINVDYKSVSFWIKPTTTFTTSSSGRQIMFFGSWTYGSITLGSATTHWDSDPEPHDELITMVDNQGSGVKHSAWIPTGGETIPNDSWTHIAFVWDGSKYVIYYNGQPQTVTPSTGHVELHTNKNIKIGTGNDGSIPLDGSIANFAMWSESLTDPQMLSVYNAGHNGDISLIQSSDLELYYTFNPYASTDPDTNSTVQDRSSNDNDSTSITGAVIDKTGTVAGTPDSITIREGLNSNKDGLGFSLTNPTSNILRLSGEHQEKLLLTNFGASFERATPITLMAWIKYPQVGGVIPDGKGKIFSDSAKQFSFSSELFNSGAKIRFLAQLGGVSSSEVQYFFDPTSPPSHMQSTELTDWIHVAFTITGDVAIGGNEVGKIYLNGTLVHTDTSAVLTSNAVIENVHIGQDRVGNSYVYHYIDELMVYNKVLSASEVEKNYKHGKGKHKND